MTALLLSPRPHPLLPFSDVDHRRRFLPPSPSFSCPCSAGTLDPEPNPGNPNPNPRERRRAVRIAWEKLVRWSRSLRSKARTDVLERTNKVVVLCGESFGPAMATAGKKAEMEVSMLIRDADVCRSINEAHFNCKYFSEHKLPENIVATISTKDALVGADFCLHAVPVQFIFS